MSFKIQIRIRTDEIYSNSNKSYEWRDVHPFNEPPYEFDTWQEADDMIDIVKHEKWDRHDYRVLGSLTPEEIKHLPPVN